MGRTVTKVVERCSRAAYNEDQLRRPHHLYLDILRGLNFASVDPIYLDPPFNSNRNYAAPVGSAAAGAPFKDTWTLSDLDVAWMGLITDAHPAIYYERAAIAAARV